MSDPLPVKGEPAHNPPTDSLQALMQLNRGLLGVIVLLICLGSIALSIVSTQLSMPATTWGERWGYRALAFVASFLVNIAAASVIYLVSLTWIIPKIKQIESKQSAQTLIVQPLFEQISAKIDELKMSDVKEYTSQFYLSPDFDNDIVAAKTIDVCVQGWDGMVTHHKAAWEQFLLSKGQVNLILPKVIRSSDPPPPLPRTMPHMLYRLGRITREHEQIAEIENTHGELCKIRDGKICNGRGKVSLWSYEPMIWYCLVVMDKTVAYVSCYEHIIDRGSIEAPFLRINLDRFPILKRWINKEVDDLIVAVRRSQETQPQTESSQSVG